MSEPRRPVRLTRRGYVVAYGLAFACSALLGACGPLWAAVPWAVTP